MNDDFIHALDSLLKIKKMSYADLASEIGVSRSTVSMWKTGKSIPRMDTLEKIAKIFNVQVSTLLCNDSDETYIGNLRLQLAEMKLLRENALHAKYFETEEKRNQTISSYDSWIQEREEFLKKCESSNNGDEKSSYMLNNFYQLNEIGQDKAIEHIEMLTKIPEYRKNNTP